MKKIEQSVYLSLSEASRMLGVHSTTLRRWADAGMVPVYVTPGGHRRFALADIEALREHKPPPVHALANSWAQRALDQARTELQRVDISPEQAPTWLTHLADEERDSWRRVSMQLMGVVLRYVSSQTDQDDEALLEEARAIGKSYALYGLHSNMPLSTALEAALFFRDSLVDAAMNMPEQANMRNEASARLLRRISQVLNVVQLSVVASYESHANQVGS
jgi:excisionase family DNA binding protein